MLGFAPINITWTAAQRVEYYHTNILGEEEHTKNVSIQANIADVVNLKTNREDDQ